MNPIKKLWGMINQNQFLKIILFSFTMAIFIVLTFSVYHPTVSQSSQLYVTVGYSSSMKNSSIITTNESRLKVGLNWAVFNLRQNQYWGTARVNTNYCNDCRNHEGSKLILSRHYPAAGEELLLLRPVPENPASVNIKKVSFSQLPTAVRREVNKRFSHYQGKYTQEECYIIDIGFDSSPDIVKAKLIVGEIASGYDSLLVRSNSTWTVRYQYGWSWE